MSEKSFELGYQVDADGLVLMKVSGAVQLGEESAEIVSRVEELLRQGHRRFVVDLSGVTRMDSTGLGRFIAVLNLVKEAGGRLILVGVREHILKSFRVTRLDRIFAFAPNVEEARRQLESV